MRSAQVAHFVLRRAESSLVSFGSVMFFRFAAALMLVVAVSMAQVGLEKQSLRLRRQISRQYYQMDELLELHAQLRLDIQKLAAPSHDIVDQAKWGRAGKPQAVQTPADLNNNRQRHQSESPLPLLRWERPVRPDGVMR